MIQLKLTFARHNFSTPADSIAPHQISYYDLTLVLNGSLTYLIDGRETVLQSGDAILIPPGSVRERRAAEGETDYVSFNFTSAYPFALPLHVEDALHSDALFLLSAFDKIDRKSVV